MRTCIVLLCALVLSSCARVEAIRPMVQVDMANVDLHIDPEVTLHVRRLEGHFLPVQRDAPLLDDKKSYAVTVNTGEVAIDLDSLNVLLARSLGGDKSNVDKLHVTIKDGELQQKGVIDSAINVPFKATSRVSATSDGRIRVHTESVRGFGIPLKGVMKVFHFDMADLVKMKKGSGVEVEGNDLIIDPSQLIPAPTIRGHLTAVRIEGQQMVQTFGVGNGARIASRPLSPNHIYWRGGQLSFGKLTMSDTDLELVDMDPKDPFDFSVDDWNAQLVVGYSKTLPNHGLKAFMPDYGDLPKESGIRKQESGLGQATGRKGTGQ